MDPMLQRIREVTIERVPIQNIPPQPVIEKGSSEPETIDDSELSSGDDLSDKSIEDINEKKQVDSCENENKSLDFSNRSELSVDISKVSKRKIDVVDENVAREEFSNKKSKQEETSGETCEKENVVKESPEDNCDSTRDNSADELTDDEYETSDSESENVSMLMKNVNRTATEIPELEKTDFIEKLTQGLPFDTSVVDEDTEKVDGEPSRKSPPVEAKSEISVVKSKRNSDSETDDENNDKTGSERKIGNLRRNIREVMDETKLDEATLAAQRQEMERLRRVQEQQRIIREVQRQIALNRQNQKTQHRVISLLQGNSSIIKQTPGTSGSSSQVGRIGNTVLVKLPNGETKPMTRLPKGQTPFEMVRVHKASGLQGKPTVTRNLLTVKGNLTPSVSIAPVMKKFAPMIKEEEPQPETPPPLPVKPKKDVVTISSSSDDDCIILSEDDEPEPEPEEDPCNSGMHTNDAYNIPDEQGRVLVNVGHPENEADIFVAPQIARIMKPHQIGGVRFLFDNVVESLDRFNTSTGFGCILAHSMGLGKTLQVVCFSDIFLRHTNGKTILCIMPINTLQNWVAEFNMWLPVDGTSSPLQTHGEVRPRNFNLHVLNDSHKSLALRAKVIQEWSKNGGVLLIGYEMYRLLSLKRNPRSKKKKKPTDVEPEEEDKNKPLFDEIHEALVKPGPDLVICDEGHRIKNSHASVSQALKQIRSKRRVVLTGYPLQNNLLEYWCMVDFVRPNYLGSRTEFSNMFERPIQNGQCIDSTPQDIRLMRYRAHVLHSLLEGFVQRRSHVVLQQSLPQKEEYVMLVRMTPFQRKLYDTFMNEVVRTKTVPNPLKAFAVCCKIWNHPDVLYYFLKKREREDAVDIDLEEVVSSTPTTTSTGIAIPANMKPNPPKRSRAKPKTPAKDKKGVVAQPQENKQQQPQSPANNKPAASIMPNTSNTNTDATSRSPNNDKPPFGSDFPTPNPAYPSNPNPNSNVASPYPRDAQNYPYRPPQDSEYYNRNYQSNQQYGNWNSSNAQSHPGYMNNYYGGPMQNDPQFPNSNYGASGNWQNQWQGGQYPNAPPTFNQEYGNRSSFPSSETNTTNTSNTDQKNPVPYEYGNRSNFSQNDNANTNSSSQLNSPKNPTSYEYGNRNNFPQTDTTTTSSTDQMNQKNPVTYNTTGTTDQNFHLQNKMDETYRSDGSAQKQDQFENSSNQPPYQPEQYNANQNAPKPVGDYNNTPNSQNNFQSDNFGNQNNTNQPQFPNTERKDSFGNNQYNALQNDIKMECNTYPNQQQTNYYNPSQNENKPETGMMPPNQDYRFNTQNIKNENASNQNYDMYNIKPEKMDPDMMSQNMSYYQGGPTNNQTPNYYGPGGNTQNYLPSQYNTPYSTNNCNNEMTSSAAPFSNQNIQQGGNENKPFDSNDVKTEVKNEDVKKEEKENVGEGFKVEKQEGDAEIKDEEGKTDLQNVPIKTNLKEDAGIPYDWAVELLKGYVPGCIENSAKMEILFCILRESMALGDRILLFSQSLFTLNLIEELLQRYEVPGQQDKWARNVNYYRLDGSTSALEREKLINEFNSNPNIHLFMVSTRAGSLGINLVGANRVIVFDASWNPCHDTQAVCRVYRYGQKKPCFVYRIVMDNCLEKRIYDRQINKQGMADRVVDECNPDAHLTMKDVTNLCWDDEKDTEIKDFSSSKDKYIDVVMQKVLDRHSHVLSKEPFQHESLLVDRKEKKLSQAEKRQAKRSYELEKKAVTNGARQPGFNTSIVSMHRRSMNDNNIYNKPIASVRPMQAELNSQIVRDGVRRSRWIPAEVWQRQGMTAQEMTLPLDVVIPTNGGERGNIVLKAGQKVLVLKSPKGIYMQLECGKIVAIRTAMKMRGNAQSQGNVAKASPSSASAKGSDDSSSDGSLLKKPPQRLTTVPMKATIPIPLKTNSSVTIIPKQNVQRINKPFTQVSAYAKMNRQMQINRNLNAKIQNIRLANKPEQKNIPFSPENKVLQQFSPEHKGLQFSPEKCMQFPQEQKNLQLARTKPFNVQHGECDYDTDNSAQKSMKDFEKTNLPSSSEPETHVIQSSDEEMSQTGDQQQNAIEPNIAAMQKQNVDESECAEQEECLKSSSMSEDKMEEDMSDANSITNDSYTSQDNSLFSERQSSENEMKTDYNINQVSIQRISDLKDIHITRKSNVTKELKLDINNDSIQITKIPLVHNDMVTRGVLNAEDKMPGTKSVDRMEFMEQPVQMSIKEKQVNQFTTSENMWPAAIVATKPETKKPSGLEILEVKSLKKSEKIDVEKVTKSFENIHGNSIINAPHDMNKIAQAAPSKSTLKNYRHNFSSQKQAAQQQKGTSNKSMSALHKLEQTTSAIGDNPNHSLQKSLDSVTKEQMYMPVEPQRNVPSTDVPPKQTLPVLPFKEDVHKVSSTNQNIQNSTKPFTDPNDSAPQTIDLDSDSDVPNKSISDIPPNQEQKTTNVQQMPNYPPSYNYPYNPGYHAPPYHQMHPPHHPYEDQPYGYNMDMSPYHVEPKKAQKDGKSTDVPVSATETTTPSEYDHDSVNTNISNPVPQSTNSYRPPYPPQQPMMAGPPMMQPPMMGGYPQGQYPPPHGYPAMSYPPGNSYQHPYQPPPYEQGPSTLYSAFQRPELLPYPPGPTDYGPPPPFGAPYHHPQYGTYPQAPPPPHQSMYPGYNDPSQYNPAAAGNYNQYMGHSYPPGLPTSSSNTNPPAS